MKVVFQFIKEELPNDLDTFQLNKEVNRHFTSNVSRDGLHIPKIKTPNFGEKSLRYSAAITWNIFINNNKEITIIKTIVTEKAFSVLIQHKVNSNMLLLYLTNNVLY